MIVSTKGRYALRVMVCFAQRGGNEYIPLKEIAESEGISQKYLESIMTTLSKAGFVDAGGIHHRQHSQADGRELKRGVLHLHGRVGLLPDGVLSGQAHVGQAGQDDRRVL